MRIALLGPEHSYCHVAGAQAYPKEIYVLKKHIDDVFRAVDVGKAGLGIVPIENMLQGSVRESYLGLAEFDVSIVKELVLPIHHCLAAQRKTFSRIASHPQALAQCSALLRRERSEGIDQLECSSTSRAMEIAADDATTAAIGSVQAAKHHCLQILKQNVEDNADNTTRFVTIAKRTPKKTSREKLKTTMLLMPKEDKPGLLFEILAVFKIQGINLTKIESMPSRRKMGEYHFIIDIDGGIEDAHVRSALGFLSTFISVRCFGSFPSTNLKG
ncbi:MAG: prephenate dehydratase [archaeon]